MIQKEKLTALLDGKSIDTKDDVKYVADYLLNNGIIVSPFKIGDRVFAVSPVGGLISRRTIWRICYDSDNFWFATEAGVYKENELFLTYKEALKASEEKLQANDY